MNMKKALVWVAVLGVLSTGVATAHGEKNRVLGTVSRVDEQNLDVKTADGHVVSVRLDKTTKYMNGKERTTWQDIKVGSRVVVHLMAHEGPPMAAEVLLPEARHDRDSAAERAIPGKG